MTQLYLLDAARTELASGAQVVPAADERDVLRFRDPMGIVVELKTT